MSFKSQMTSASTYAVTGTGGAIATVATPDRIESMKQQFIIETKVNAPWMYDWFPSLVDSGMLLLKNGSIFIGGIALSELLTMTLTIVSFAFLIIQGLSNISLFRLKFEKAMNELVSSEMKKKNKKD